MNPIEILREGYVADSNILYVTVTALVKSKSRDEVRIRVTVEGRSKRSSRIVELSKTYVQDEDGNEVTTMAHAKSMADDCFAQAEKQVDEHRVTYLAELQRKMRKIV